MKKNEKHTDDVVNQKLEAVIAEMDPVTEALRPGRKSPEIVKSPILGLTDTMPSIAIENVFRGYQADHRNATSKVLDAVTADLGAKVRIADKARRATFDEIKEEEKRAKQIAQKDYQTALRAAKSVLDATDARITKLGDDKRAAAAREVFNGIATPINVELETMRNKITEDYSATMTAAVLEMRPIAKVAFAREEKIRADMKAKRERDDAAKKEEAALATSVPAGPVGPIASPVFAGGFA